jgi:heat shock protein HtpX
MTFNTFKTVLLLGLLSGVLLVGGEALGGRNGLYIGLALAAVMNFGSYFFSDKIALASYSAQPVTETENPDVYRRVAPIVGRLAQRMNIPMPKLYVLPEQSPNAFATGRNPKHASVAFTAGVLQLMNDQELEAVVAHELGHVLHRDILISSVAATMAAAITVLARMAQWGMMFAGGRGDDERRGGIVGELLMLILAPIAAMLIQMAISRSREYDADAASAKYVGSPYPLIQGLEIAI